MDDRDIKELHKKSVEFLKNNIDVMDIYEFAEQALVFSEFFLKKWNEWVDVSEEGLKDAQVKRYVENLIKLRMLRDQDYLGGFNIKIKWFND